MNEFMDEMSMLSVSIKEALDAYKVAMEERGNRESSREMTMHRLITFFTDEHMALRDLTPKKAAALYERYRTTPTRMKKPPSPATHRNVLAEARTFLAWCVGQRYLSESPLAEVEGVGRRPRGKAQLTRDESRRFLDCALARKDERGTAAALALLLALRASEITGLVARSVDDGGALLHVFAGKTNASVRSVSIPEVLRPRLVALAAGKLRDAPLFPGWDRDWVLRSVRMICRAAKVPIVSAHGLRGTHATLAYSAGATGDLVAAQLGHTSAAVTESSYAKADAVAGGTQRRALTALKGGKK